MVIWIKTLCWKMVRWSLNQSAGFVVIQHDFRNAWASDWLTYTSTTVSPCEQEVCRNYLQTVVIGNCGLVFKEKYHNWMKNIECYMLFSYQTGYIMCHSRLRIYIAWGAAEGNIYHKPGMSHYIPCLIAELQIYYGFNLLFF